MWRRFRFACSAPGGYHLGPNDSNERRTAPDWKSGGHVFGCMLSQMASTRFEQVLAGSTLDYAVIDSEHGSRDRTEIQNLTGMLRRADITPIVRIPIPKSEWVAMALDAGAGVLVPYCETVEDVQACVATAKWHPLKGEYLRRAVEDNVRSPRPRGICRTGVRNLFVIIGIESEPAYKNLDAILDVGGIDAVFIGPNDMSTSLGSGRRTRNIFAWSKTSSNAAPPARSW